MNGKSSNPPKGQRGHVTGCERAYGGGCEVHPGARGVMASGKAAVIGLAGYMAGMSIDKSGTAFATPLVPVLGVRAAFFIFIVRCL